MTPNTKLAILIGIVILVIVAISYGGYKGYGYIDSLRQIKASVDSQTVEYQKQLETSKALLEAKNVEIKKVQSERDDYRKIALRLSVSYDELVKKIKESAARVDNTPRPKSVNDAVKILEEAGFEVLKK
jgi:predicted  nucleic acid-binding Zn-ribbon protein